MPIRFLNLVKPFLPFLPGVPAPKQMIPMDKRVMWTALALFVFLVASQIPVYGFRPGKSSDPFYWMRVILASNKGTLMELGISPIVTTGMIMQLLSGTNIISVDESNKEDRRLFNGAQKLAGLAATVIEAVAYVMSGSYGDVQMLGFITCFLIVLQLFCSGMICLLLDELLQKGYGLGSGISLFIATNICETIVWKCFSPATFNSGRGTEFEGAIIALFHLVITRGDKVRALKEAFYRPHLTNVTNLLATGLVFVVVIFLQGFQVMIPFRRQQGPVDYKPIKLLYTSNMPIILQTALVSNLFFFSNILYKRFPSNVLIGLLGRWEDPEFSPTGTTAAVGGLAYYLSPPQTLADMVSDPFHVMFYVLFVVATCSLFSRAWIHVSGSNSSAVAKQMHQNGESFPGKRNRPEFLIPVLDHYIPIAASCGGLCIGLLAVCADFLGAIGSGTGILLAVTIIYQFYETLRERRVQQ